MNARIENDMTHVSFEDSAQESALIDAASKMASAIDKSRSGSSLSAESASAWAESIEQMDVAELLESMDESIGSPSRMLFFIAEVFAKADLEIAWCGLASLPAILSLHEVTNHRDIDGSHHMLAFPCVRDDSIETREWVLFHPNALQKSTAWLWNPKDGGLVGPVMRNTHSTQLRIGEKRGLLGFSNASATRFDLPPGSSQPEIMQINAQRIEHIRICLLALFGGLLSGGVQRLVTEAYVYAKTRQSFGKPIAQHQAVAIRLADIALNHDAMRLCLLAELSRPQCDRFSTIARYAGEAACEIAREAVQVAAAHGYVDGLPFKRLFEQTRTLSTILSIVVGEDE